MEIESKIFDLFKDKAINVLRSQLALFATGISILVVGMAGGYEKVYYIKLAVVAIYLSVVFFILCDLKYREYRREYINILVLSSIKEIAGETKNEILIKKEDLISRLSKRLLIDKKDIEISIDDLVERDILKAD